MLRPSIKKIKIISLNSEFATQKKNKKKKKPKPFPNLLQRMVLTKINFLEISTIKNDINLNFKFRPIAMGRSSQF